MERKLISSNKFLMNAKLVAEHALSLSKENALIFESNGMEEERRVESYVIHHVYFQPLYHLHSWNVNGGRLVALGKLLLDKYTFSSNSDGTIQLQRMLDSFEHSRLTDAPLSKDRTEAVYTTSLNHPSWP
jgi:hypothetical protein